MSSLGLCTYKDEVTELNLLLNNSENQRDPVKYKELVQQVILYMTKGIDMTPLFATIVKAAATRDLVQKKLCYLYLCHCASSHPDLALLTVNTLKRDAQDTNPMIRGLALKSMGSLRLVDLVQYTKDVMLKALEDHSPYVRKAAVIGCLQLHQLAPDEMSGDILTKKLSHMLQKDKNIQVRCNCLYALEEMKEVFSTSALEQYLSKRLHRFDEWGQQFTLDMLMRDLPKSEEDIYNTLNTLDVCLKHSNISVVLGAVRIFLHLSSEIMELRNDVFNRIKVPLVTAISSKPPEIVYAVLCHIEIILYKAPTLFEDSISSFFCRQNDPLYLKVKKLEVLSKLVTESNGKQILEELSYHAKRSETSSHSVSHIGMMALLHPEVADICIEKLFYFLSFEDHLITSHTLAAFRDLIIKYDKCNALLSDVAKYLKEDLLPNGKSSAVWILGEFGEDILESPYILESLIDNISETTPPSVKLELLTATMKLFFKRPPECQEMLGHLLEYCIEKDYHVDVRDRALLYYRLLRTNLTKAKEVICCPRSAQFIDNANVVMIDSKELLFLEFNTLAAVYGQPSSSFVQNELREYSEVIVNIEAPGNISQEIAEETIAGQYEEPLNESNSEALVPVGDDSLQTLKLVEKPNLSPQIFEALWRQLPETESYELELDNLPDQGEFQRLLTQQRIYTMASTPPDEETIRYFFYAQATGYILCEVTVDISTHVLKSLIKMEDPAYVHSFIELFQSCL